MKATQIALLGIIPAALFIAACGDDVTQVTKIEETSGLEVVASADSLGKCSEEISGEMKFASKENAVYVCADSAWKNVSEAEKTTCSAEALSDSSGFKIVCDGDSIGIVKNGSDGADGKDGAKGEKGDKGESSVCTVETLSDSSGFKIVCGGDSIGVVKNGEDGTDGKDGAKGEKGDKGESSVCTVETLSDSSGFKIVCDGDSVGVVQNGSDGGAGENCVLSDNGDGTVSVVCGESSATLYKALCGNKPYEPDSSTCLDNLVIKNSVLLKKKKVWDLMNPATKYTVFIDKRDGHVYRSVKIGKQIWMAENLNYFIINTMCPGDTWTGCDLYGRLYTWEAAMKACPEGWHLPNKAEFNTLIDAVGGAEVAGTALKATSGWDRWPGNDDYGFSALGAGNFTNSAISDFYSEFGAYFWSSEESNDSKSYILELSTLAKSLWHAESQRDGGSVRCVRD